RHQPPPSPEPANGERDTGTERECAEADGRERALELRHTAPEEQTRVQARKRGGGTHLEHTVDGDARDRVRARNVAAGEQQRAQRLAPQLGTRYQRRHAVSGGAEPAERAETASRAEAREENLPAARVGEERERRREREHDEDTGLDAIAEHAE